MKIIVIGCPGSGKSTFSKKISKILNLPIYHLDMLYHNSDGTHISKEELEEKLKTIFKENNNWIIDGNYQRTLEMRMKECDTIILLDYPIEICLAGAEARIGTQREDLPFIEEKLDENFKQSILDFSREKLPQIHELIKKYKKTKNIIIFKSREEADRYIQSFNQNI